MRKTQNSQKKKKRQSSRMKCVFNSFQLTTLTRQRWVSSVLNFPLLSLIGKFYKKPKKTVRLTLKTLISTRNCKWLSMSFLKINYFCITFVMVMSTTCQLSSIFMRLLRKASLKTPINQGGCTFHSLETIGTRTLLPKLLARGVVARMQPLTFSKAWKTTR